MPSVFLQPLAAVTAYLRSEGLEADQIREIVALHASENVDPQTQYEFVQSVLAPRALSPDEGTEQFRCPNPDCREGWVTYENGEHDRCPTGCSWGYLRAPDEGTEG